VHPSGWSFRDEDITFSELGPRPMAEFRSCRRPERLSDIPSKFAVIVEYDLSGIVRSGKRSMTDGTQLPAAISVVPSASNATDRTDRVSSPLLQPFLSRNSFSDSCPDGRKRHSTTVAP
jgi:hypothetical protein